MVSWLKESVSRGKISSRTNRRIQASCSSNSGSVEKSHATMALLSIFRLVPRANYRNGMPGDTTATPIRTTVTLSAPNRDRRRAEPERVVIDSAAARQLLADAGTALLDERRLLTGDELTALAALPDEWVTSLAALAHQVRLAW